MDGNEGGRLRGPLNGSVWADADYLARLQAEAAEARRLAGVARARAARAAAVVTVLAWATIAWALLTVVVVAVELAAR